MSLLDTLTQITVPLMGERGYAEGDWRRFASDESSWLTIAYGPEPTLTDITEADLEKTIPQTVHGFGIAGVWDRDRIADELYAPLEHLEAESALSAEDYPLGYVRDVVVRESSQGQGIGWQLCEHLGPEISRYTNGIVVPIWEREDSPSDAIVQAFGGEPMCRFEEYDLYQDGADCPVCPDDGDCTCEFVMYGDLNLADVLVPPNQKRPLEELQRG